MNMGKRSKKSDAELEMSHKEKVANTVRNADKWMARVAKYATSRRKPLTASDKAKVENYIDETYARFKQKMAGAIETTETFEL
jgi:ClpP class serine protease